MTSLEQKLTAAFEGRPNPEELPSASVAVLDDKGLTKMAFNSSESTLFQAASISKSVAALTTLRLVADDVIGLDDDVNDHLTSWQMPTASGRTIPITIRQLLSHSAGLTVHGFPGYAANEPLPTLQEVLNGTGPSNTGPVRPDGIPGLAFRYSGGGFTVLQQLLEDVTAGPFAALTEELVFKPCEMTDASFGQPTADNAATAHIGGKPVVGGWHRYPEQAAAGMWCTPTDLIKFVAAVREATNGDTALLPRHLAQEMLTTQIAPLGLGLFIESDPVLDRFGHTGGNYGYQCVVSAARHGSHAMAIMTNSDNATEFLNTARGAVREATRWPHSPDRPLQGPPGVKTAREWTERYCGDYRLESGKIITIGCADLDTDGPPEATVSVAGQPALDMEVVSLEMCAVTAVRTYFVFDLDEDGRPRSLTVRQRDATLTATPVPK